jgi:PAS domain S-box-containing protein
VRWDLREGFVLETLKCLPAGSSAVSIPHIGPILEALPVAIYTTDADGVLTSYNSAAVALWGEAPEIGSATWCGSWKLLNPDGTPMAHDACPMALAIKNGAPRQGEEAVALRPDGTQIPFLAFPTPLYGPSGQLAGAVNMLIDLTDRKNIERTLIKRGDEQRALFQLTNVLQHAKGIDDVHQAALDVIVQAMHCQRASILLFDEAGTMRFTAWRGLSEEYRAAVEGHSPWTADVIEPEPICIDDLARCDSLGGDLKATIEREGIAALAFVPLMAETKLIGKFMVYFDAPHAFEPDELAFAVTIGRQVGFAVHRMYASAARARAEEALRASEHRLQFALKAGRMGAWEWNVASGAVIWSPLIEEMHGLAPGSFGGTFEEFQRDIHPDDRDRVLDAIRRVLATGEDYRISYRIRRPDGEVRWLEASGKLIGSPERPERLTGVCTDITERKQSEERVNILMREVNHRSKNLLALVQAVAKHTVASQPYDFVQRFSDRLRGLAASQDLLIEGGWRGTDMGALVRSQLAHFVDLIGSRISLSGPQIHLSASAAQSVGMALHELATNAGKYGALSNTAGTVECGWDVTDSELAISWTERGGPAVATPHRRGFGHTVICSMAQLGLGAKVVLEFEPTGLVWQLRCPREAAIEPREAALAS